MTTTPRPPAIRRIGTAAARSRRHAVGVVLVAAALAAAHPAAGAAVTAGQPVARGNVEVAYGDTAQFTEMRRNPGERTDWLDDLSRFTADQAARRLPAGERLAVTITDVQRAGMFEPWRRGNLSNVRIVCDTTPPRITLRFRLESAQGAVLKEGERRLEDVAFLRRSSRYRSDELGHEKNLIDGWLERELRGRTAR